MGARRLDASLLGKLVRKLGKDEKYIREQISKRANKLGISSEAYLVIWAKKERLGTGTYQRKLAPEVQAEIRGTLPSILSPRPTRPSLKPPKRASKAKPPTITKTIDLMIRDQYLLDRCRDLLKARGNFDRVFREATTVLEDRIKRLSGIRNMRTVDLVGKVINPKPEKAILKVSDEAYEQEGFYSICKGLMLAFRDTTHHELSNKFQREDALVFCGFIDSILAILGKAKKQEAA